MQLRDLPVFFLDLQTTGSHPKSGEVLEIAWGNSPQGFQSSLVQQEKGYIPYHIQKLTGISEDDLIVAKPRQTLIEELKHYGNHLCVVHFAQFETPFLQSWYPEQIPFSIICTHDIARRLYPNLPTKSLKGMAGFFGHQKEDIKRSKAHAEATEVIWHGLIPELEKIGIQTIEQLNDFLSLEFKKKKAKYEYPLEKEKRLGLTKSPGVYRMMNRSGEILYVGKATSLHSRVNSYFRGQRNRDTKKLEMLTQVWDLQITECQSPLEAALLETDEIKRLDPPYNVSLKTNDRKLTFFSKDFQSYSFEQNEIHNIGPFTHSLILDSVRKLSQSLQCGHFSSHIFFDVFPSELLEEGFQLFCMDHQVQAEKFKSVRSIIAYGIKLLKKGTLDLLIENNIDNLQTITAQDLAEKFERHFKRAAQAYLRARSLTRLLNSRIEFPVKKKKNCVLCFQNGRMVDERSYSKLKPRSKEAWKSLNIHDYDRMSVLYSELMKLRKPDQESKSQFLNESSNLHEEQNHEAEET